MDLIIVLLSATKMWKLWRVIEGIKGRGIRRICSLLRFSAMIPSVGPGVMLVGGGEWSGVYE